MENLFDSPAELLQPEPEDAVADDDQVSLIVDELREAIRRKIAPPAA